MPDFRWTPKRSEAAILLADGNPKSFVCRELGIDQKTLWRWSQESEFSVEVDRLTLMMGVASRAERLRIVKRIIRERIRDDAPIQSDKDILDWLKFAQGETDGIKLDLTALADNASPVAGSGSN